MVLPGHIAGGYIAGTLALSVCVIPPEYRIPLLAIATIAGELPDIDLLFFALKKSKIGNHRSYITHIPLFWITVGVIGMLVSWLLEFNFTFFASIMLIAGTMSHFILDSFDYGIRWFAPFSDRRFALQTEEKKFISNAQPGTLVYYWHFVTRAYWKLATFWFEILVTGIALWFFLRH